MVNKWRIDSCVDWFNNRSWRVWNPRGHLTHVGSSYEAARLHFIRVTDGDPGVIVETHEVPG